MKRIDSQTETRALALLARGDSYDDIVSTFVREGTPVSKSTLVSVKRRNTETLKYMQDALVQHELNKSTQILAKARQLLEKKIHKALLVDDKLDELTQELKDHEIELNQYELLVKTLRKDDISVAVLTTLTKEMFNQSQVEQGKPTVISENPQQARENLKTLLQAIDAKDEEKILKAIFVEDDQPIPVSD